MVVSTITGKRYNEAAAIYITNPLQCLKYFEYLGPEFFLDIIYTGQRNRSALVYVWKRCPETKQAKELWDNHQL